MAVVNLLRGVGGDVASKFRCLSCSHSSKTDLCCVLSANHEGYDLKPMAKVLFSRRSCLCFAVVSSMFPGFSFIGLVVCADEELG